MSAVAETGVERDVTCTGILVASACQTAFDPERRNDPHGDHTNLRPNLRRPCDSRKAKLLCILKATEKAPHVGALARAAINKQHALDSLHALSPQPGPGA